ncbi:hypothetical protein GW17_00057816 [Ensete ventricosum]|nr:hypothetical protein GW17_00057816 [Ensete ventricosum]
MARPSARVAGHGQTPCKGAGQGLATCKEAAYCGQGSLQGGCRLWPREPARAIGHNQLVARPRLAYDRGCLQGAIARG